MNQGNLFSHSKTLLTRLEQEHRDAVDRDLVFVAHSLGGILAKDVRRRSADHSDARMKKVYKSTTAVLFFGTPHRGSTQAGVAEDATFIPTLPSHGHQQQYCPITFSGIQRSRNSGRVIHQTMENST